MSDDGQTDNQNLSQNQPAENPSPEPMVNETEMPAANQAVTDELKKEDQASSQANVQPTVVTDVQTKKKLRLPRTELIFPKSLRNHLGNAARPLSLLVIVLIIAAAGYGGFRFIHTAKTASYANIGVTKFKASSTAFQVVSTIPKSNQTGVSPTTAITIKFSQPVNPQKLLGNLFLTPNVPGTFSQGSDSSTAVFTPTTPFPDGTKVQVMLNGSYISNNGSKLGAALIYGFTTSLPQDGVIFQDSSGLYSIVSSAPVGQAEDYSLVFGSNISSNVNVSLYKGTMSALLSSLVYSSENVGGTSVPSFNNQAIDTNSMQLVSAQKGLSSNASYKVDQPAGVYLAVATDSSGNQVGFVWVDYSDFGVVAREDDQKIVADAQMFNNSADVSVSAQVYNLENSVNQLASSTINGLTTINSPFSPSADVVVASDGTSQALVPLNILESQGDIRVDQDLSSALSIYGVTDRPTYSTTDTVDFAGYVRNNQDAQYTVYSSGPIKMYAASYIGGPALASFSVTPNADGVFSGSFSVDPSWLSGASNAQFQIFAVSPSGISTNDVQVAGFTLTSAANPTSNITVSFSKKSYLPTDTIQATISGTNASGSPLANTMVDVHTYTEDYYENDPTANLANFGNTGAELSGSPATVELNSNGQAIYTLDVKSLPNDGNSQMVTIQANLHGATSGAAGGESVIVHQGDGSLDFGVGRNVVSTSGTIIGRVYAKKLNGSVMANAAIGYSLINTTNSNSVVASGSTTTDGNGLATITTAVPSGTADSSSLELSVWTSDAQNNKIEANSYYYIDNSTNFDTSGAGLQELDVSGAPTNLSVGQTVNLVINSPSNLKALVTMDRGRIYQPQMVNLNAGNNNFSFNVTSELAPSFTLTFNYFENGVYHSEGVQFVVSQPTKLATLSLAPPATKTVSANLPTTIQINAKGSSGSPLSTDLIVDVVSNDAYVLNSQVNPSMYQSLYPNLPIMTSSASSLSSIGSGGGGRCGGGGGGSGGFTNPVGNTLLWQPDLQTNSSGQASVTFTPPKGQWRVNVFSMNNDTVVGSTKEVITAE